MDLTVLQLASTVLITTVFHPAACELSVVWSEVDKSTVHSGTSAALLNDCEVKCKNSTQLERLHRSVGIVQ